MLEKIRIEDYNPAWAEVFQCMSAIFQNELGDLILSIEHIGSTSVKGLSAKPIIDIDVVIENENLFPQVIKRLEKLGYFHEGDLGIKKRQSFGRLDQFVPIDKKGTIWMEHHLYVCQQDSPELKRHLKFRDYLRANVGAVIEYERLKKELARSAKDRDSYTLGKGEFIESILKED